MPELKMQQASHSINQCKEFINAKCQKNWNELKPQLQLLISCLSYTGYRESMIIKEGLRKRMLVLTTYSSNITFNFEISPEYFIFNPGFSSNLQHDPEAVTFVLRNLDQVMSCFLKKIKKDFHREWERAMIFGN